MLCYTCLMYGGFKENLIFVCTLGENVVRFVYDMKLVFASAEF